MRREATATVARLPRAQDRHQRTWAALGLGMAALAARALGLI